MLLLTSAEDVGSGYALMSFAVTGSQRLDGMMLPTKGSRINAAGLSGFCRVVNGSYRSLACQ